eukprot:tig00021517_g21990.t1
MDQDQLQKSPSLRGIEHSVDPYEATLERTESRRSVSSSAGLMSPPRTPRRGSIVPVGQGALAHEGIEKNVVRQKPWYKEAVFYEVYTRAFCDSNADGHGDIAGITSKLDYLASLGVDCIWLLPIHPSPLKDDGYDAAPPRPAPPRPAPDPRAGPAAPSPPPSVAAAEPPPQVLIDAVHERHMRIIMDFIPNHTSDQHFWFQEARKGPENPYHDYYVWSDSPDKYKGVRIIFTDTNTSNWDEILNIMAYWLDMGIDGFRVDAWPEDVREYFGEGEGDEFHLAFHFPVMPRIFMALKVPLVQLL